MVKKGTDLLVCEDVTADIPLSSLNKLNVSLHSFLGVRLCEEVTDIGVGVQTAELKYHR